MEVINIIVTIAMATITILLGIIGFFIVRQLNKQDATNEKLFTLISDQKEVTSKLSIAITALNGTMLSMTDKYEEHKQVCAERFKNLT